MGKPMAKAKKNYQLDDLSDIAKKSITEKPKINLDKRIDTKAARERLEQAFHNAFEAVGGVPRLIYWADANYGDFIKMMAKLMPQQILQDTQHHWTIQGAIVPNTLSLSPQPIPSLPAIDGEAVPITVDDAAMTVIDGETVDACKKTALEPL